VGLAAGFIAPPPDQPIGLYRLSAEETVYSVIANLLMIIVVALLAGNLSERLRAAGGRIVEAEERAVAAERMAALGRLAAGLAHEIRNPLGSIRGSIQMVHQNPALSDEDRELCLIVQREADRLNDLVTDMMDLARRRAPNLVCVDMVGTTRDVVQLAGTSGRASGDVLVTLDAPDHEVRVFADPAQLRQLIWNLVRNAVQASKPADTVRVQIIEDAGGTVRLVVEDDGIGLDAEARERMFDPFVTTRSKGAGIGLAVVKRIADDHRFAIDVRGDLGQGALFEVTLGARVTAALGSPAPDPRRWTLNPTGLTGT
jgi:signal transduction histidine kinase